jgi:hypothetical protein
MQMPDAFLPECLSLVVFRHERRFGNFLCGVHCISTDLRLGEWRNADGSSDKFFRVLQRWHSLVTDGLWIKRRRYIQLDVRGK